jgi:hypothetical protein
VVRKTEEERGRGTDGNNWEAEVEVVSREDNGLQRHGARESAAEGAEVGQGERERREERGRGLLPVGGVVEESANEEKVLEERVQHQLRGADVIVPPVLEQQRSKKPVDRGVRGRRGTEEERGSTPELSDRKVRIVGSMSAFVSTDPHP